MLSFPFAHRRRCVLSPFSAALASSPLGTESVALLAGVVACAAIAGCHSAGGSSDANAATAPTAQVVTAQRGDIARVLTLAGQFQPYQVVDVHPKVSGYMKHINVDIGDVVHQGQTIAVLEVPELKAQLQQTVFEMQQSNEEI